MCSIPSGGRIILIIAQEKSDFSSLPDETGWPVKRRRRRFVLRGPGLIVVGLILAAFFVGGLIIYYCSQMLILSYQISCLEKELAVLRVENQGLGEDISRLATIERLEYLAINKLGMIKPDSGNVLVVAIDDKALHLSGTGEQEEQATEISPAGGEKSLLIKVFTELVSRLEDSKGHLGRGCGNDPGEGKDANYKHFNPQKNYTGLFSGNGDAFAPNFTPGLDSAC